MKSRAFKEMDRTRRIKLSGSELFWHFFIILLPLFLTVLNVFTLYQFYFSVYYAPTSEQDLWWNFGITLFIALFLLALKIKRLRLQQIDISLPPEKFQDVMEAISKKTGWNLRHNQKEFARFENGSLLTWGMYLTVIRQDEYVLVNSICNPYVGGSISILNENSRNIKKLKRLLLELEQKELI